MAVSVISIDPAPSKTSTVCDGKTFCEKTAGELRAMLDDVGPDTLICWDAPLTGPRDPDRAGAAEKDFSQRRIDSFFARGATGFKAPKGISVLPYSGCPHWVITRSLLGLPRTGRWDKSYRELPFRLLPGGGEKEVERPSVVEIHPAVAAWLWCRDERHAPKDEDKEGWLYKPKKNKRIREWMWGVIRGKTEDVPCADPLNGDDDDFDAAVGYLLGFLYLRDRDELESGRSVVLLGDRGTGSFLLPNAPGLLDRWSTFAKASN